MIVARNFRRLGPARLMSYSVVLILVALLPWHAATASDTASPQLKLWYDKPAARWEEALPLGNGRLGAMVYGGVAEETVQLNEDTFWAGSPYNNLNPKAAKALPEIRRLLNEGQFEAASKLGEQAITSQGAQGMPYQSAGALRLSFDTEGDVRDYYRELDLENAVARTRFTLGSNTHSREVFSSLVDDVVVVRLRSSEPGGLNFFMTLEHPDGFPIKVSGRHQSLLMTGHGRSHEGVEGKVRLANFARIASTDGSVTGNAKGLQITGASEALLLVSIATNFNSYRDISGNAEARARTKMAAAQAAFEPANAYSQRLAAHSDQHRHYFARVSFELPAGEFADEPTDLRIAKFAGRRDPSLVPLYFQFGRYLLIASSQPGSQPANLQGIWNAESEPAWDSKYTLNINAEMNYWPAEVTNLSELHEPFIALIRDLSESGQAAAQQMYDARGWMAHHNTDLWRFSGAIDWSWGAWPTSNAWLSQHIWQKYLYTGDLHFLRNHYAILREASVFFEDFLVEDRETGWLVVSPSMSPENPAPATGVKMAAGATMDNQLLFDLFSHTIAAAELLDIDSEATRRWRALLANLPPMQVGRYHQLQEWLDDWDDPNDDHRHVSHLYGLYPSNQISPLHSPLLAEAARVSLEQRGDPSTGWSMNWKINLWARLLDGNRALKLIRDQIRPASFPDSKFGEDGGTYPNMMDAHPPFQIDGNFGFTSGVAEMLAQSHDGAVFLLPALPSAWPEGKVTGLVMRGGFVVDMTWKESRVTWLKVVSRLGGNLRLRSLAPLPQPQGFKVSKAKGVNTNAFYQLPEIKPPLKHTEINLPAVSFAASDLVDIATEAGGVYEFRDGPKN